MLSRKEPDLEHLKNSQSIHIAKKEKMSSGGNTRSVAGHSIKPWYYCEEFFTLGNLFKGQPRGSMDHASRTADLKKHVNKYTSILCSRMFTEGN